MIPRSLAAALLALALPAAAQSVPAGNFTDMWWNPAEDGWGISFMQHDDRAFVVWYTYDPREPDPGGQFKPLWIVMPGGRWTAPNTVTGQAYVFNGVPFFQSGSNRSLNPVGSFTFTFSGLNDGNFRYDIAAPAGLAPSDPAFNLPPMSGSRPITRLVY